MPVVFNEENHTYTNPDTGENYISVTTLLGNYKPKFDVNAAAERVAKREGVSVDTIKEYWADLGRIATTRGSFIHSIFENYIKDKKEPTDKNRFLVNFLKGQLKRNGGLTPSAEEIQYNDDLKIAGMADLVLEGKEHFKIWDFKTNKEIRFTNNFNEDRFLIEPVDHLPNCEYSIYSLQLSLYAYMKEILTGKKCLELKIIHLKRDKIDPEKVEIFEYYLPYLKSDIQKILKI